MNAEAAIRPIEEGTPLSAPNLPPPIVALLRDTLRQKGLVLLTGPAGASTQATAKAALGTLAPDEREAVLAVEIGGPESARRAVEAAVDGKPVLATLESVDAVAAVLALRTLTGDPFTLALALKAVAAQRLVRRLCPPCREPAQAHGSEGALLGFDPGAVVWHPGGCGRCGGSGYSGWIGVFEAIRIDEALRRLVAGGDAAVIASHAFRHAPNLAAAARALVREGATSPEEAIRLSRS